MGALPLQTHGGPVTLVVEKDYESSTVVYSWSFSSEHAALSVIQAFRNSERWFLLRGVFANAAAAGAAARKIEFVLRSSGGSGFIHRCELPAEALLDEKLRSSA